MNAFVPSDEQRRIIVHPLAPLRVSAGAGTGKTTTVARRIGHLVSTHGLEPEEILGITFTNKAAAELADRVRQVIDGAVEPSRQVEVHTYHGFAAQILREFGPLIGVERDTAVITPTFTRQMLSEIVRYVPLPNLNATWSGTIDLIRRLGAFLGDNLLSPSAIAIPADADGPWPARVDLLRALQVYESEKRRLGVADYADLVTGAYRLVAEHPWVPRRIRARYRAVVLDEYQDTNPAQRLLLTTIFGGGFPVTAVGDADQTIYEWRGASPANFRRFPQHFPQSSGEPAPTLPLTGNRRSASSILDVANAIRSRIDDTPRMPLTPVEGAGAGEVRAGWFDDAVAEAEFIADDVVSRHTAGVAWKDIAILFRKNKDISVIRDALSSRDIPIEVANLGGLLSIPEVVELHAWLRLLDMPEDGPALARLLTGSRHRLGLGDLAVLSRWVRARRSADDADPGEPAIPYTLLEAIDHLDELSDLRPEARAALDTFRATYRVLIQAAQAYSLVELCRQILDRTGAWRDVEALDDAARLTARLNLYRFLDLAEQWSPLEGRPSLTAFLDYLRTMDQEPAEELDTARLAGADAVTLLTVHRAKGLEWPVVYVPAAYQGNFPSRVVGAHDNPLRQPESLPYEFRIDHGDLPMLRPEDGDDEHKRLLKQRHDSQEWRIAYVGATRAKEALTITGAHWYGYPEPTQRPAKPSDLYHLVSHHPVTRVIAPLTPPGPRPETVGYRTERLPSPDPLFGSEGWESSLRSALARPEAMAEMAHEHALSGAYDAAVTEFEQLLLSLPELPEPVSEDSTSTSVTGLVTYASCPRRFFWSEVDRLPRNYSAAARRGVEVHRRIELHHVGVMPLSEAAPDLYDMTGSDGPASEGMNAFSVFSASRFAASKPILVEAPFELGLGDRTTVRGRIDAVYGTEDRRWEIVDFKSGRRSGDPSAIVQLEAYAVAARRVDLGPEPPESLSVTFAYLGGALEEVTHDADEAWISGAENHLDALARGIEDQHFDPTPSAACGRCDFLRFCPAGRDHLSS